MLLYHFPLTSNSATPNLENKGLKSDYVIGDGGSFVTGGKLSSCCYKTNKKLIQCSLNNDNFSLCFRVRSSILQVNYSDLFSIVGCGFSISYDTNNGVCVYHTGLDSDIPSRLFQSNDNIWHDVVVVVYNSKVYLYIDSIYKGYSQLSNDVTLIRFCGKDNTYQRWDCYLQDIRIYDHVLSQQEIKDYSKALVLHYPLNGSEFGNTIKDVSGFGNDYTKNASKSYIYLSNSPRYGKHINTNDENLKSVSTTSAIKTKSVWCKNGNDWYFLANNGSKYVNGVVSSQYDNILSNASELSDIRIYASALSESDIKALYNQPISLGNSLNAIELVENAKFKSFAWRTLTYNEMDYIINRRQNASNLKALGGVNVNGTYVNGCFIMPDDFVAPEGVTFIPDNNFLTNRYTLEQFRKLENVGAVFVVACRWRNGNVLSVNNVGGFYLGSSSGVSSYRFRFLLDGTNGIIITNKYNGIAVRLCKEGSQFSVSATKKIDFAPANLQYHCTKHIWKFAEHQYDVIGSANENISDTYNGWIDLFGYGTSGKNYSPTLHSINNADYASGDISGTDNDWGVNEITTAEHEENNIKLYKSGVITANEISEGDTNEFTANSIQVTKLKED